MDARLLAWGHAAARRAQGLPVLWLFTDTVRLAEPRAAALRTLVYSHTIHHRGQFTMYLRLCDLPMPGLYGPSADEAM